MPRSKIPIQFPFEPMLSARSHDIPQGSHWQYEPKWDGFRAIIVREQSEVQILSRNGQPLGRYFPELVDEIQRIREERFVLDGEIVLFQGDELSFNDLQLRLHPAESRVRRLSKEIPASFFAFDILHSGDTLLLDQPLSERRPALERFFRKVPRNSRILLSPASCDLKQARDWFENFGHIGLDGVMAKNVNEPYRPGDRSAMIKVKHLKTADCVVAGFRYQTGGKAVAAITLGLYGEDGLLHHVGSSSSFNLKQRKELLKVFELLKGGSGFTGNAPGQSRWSKQDNPWVPLQPKLVCEVEYDYYSQGRFRHGTHVVRWRDDRDPKSCTFEQLKVVRPRRARKLLAA